MGFLGSQLRLTFQFGELLVARSQWRVVQRTIYTVPSTPANIVAQVKRPLGSIVCSGSILRRNFQVNYLVINSDGSRKNHSDGSARWMFAMLT